jgi:cytochrome P450
LPGTTRDADDVSNYLLFKRFRSASRGVPGLFCGVLIAVFCRGREIDFHWRLFNMAAATRPPVAPGHWLLGNLPDFRKDMLGFFTRTAREQGDVVMMQLGTRRPFLISHPDFVEQVLVTENRKFGKSYVFELLRAMLGNGLLNSEGDFWLRQRRLMQPAFSRASVNNYAGIIVSQSEKSLGQWIDGQSCDLHHEMTRLTLGIVGRTLMDVDLTEVSKEIAEPLDEAMRDFSRRFESAFNVPQWVPTPRNRRRVRNVAKLDTVVHRIIRQRRESGGDRGDLLSKLIQLRDEVDQTGMTDRQLRDEVMTLFLAGHETTANALSWTWFLLAQHPEVEKRLLAELKEVVGDRMPEAADVPKLTYTEAVLKESLRLYPPAYAFSRRVLTDVTIGGYQIPAGRAVIMSQWVVHRDPRWWDEPLKFRPERWLNGDQSKRPDYAYFPFGGGPRVCIGNTFAMLEATLVVAAIAPRIRLELVAPEKVKPWPSVTLRPAGGIPAVLHRRSARAAAADTVSAADATVRSI